MSEDGLENAVPVKKTSLDYPEASPEVRKVYERCLKEVESWGIFYPKMMKKLEFETSVEEDLFLSGLTRRALQDWIIKPTRLFFLGRLPIFMPDTPQDPEKIKKVEKELLDRVSIKKNEVWNAYCANSNKDPDNPLAQKYLGTIMSAAHLVHAAITTEDPGKVYEYCETWASKIAAARENFLNPSPQPANANS